MAGVPTNEVRWVDGDSGRYPHDMDLMVNNDLVGFVRTERGSSMVFERNAEDLGTAFTATIRFDNPGRAMRYLETLARIEVSNQPSKEFV